MPKIRRCGLTFAVRKNISQDEMTMLEQRTKVCRVRFSEHFREVIIGTDDALSKKIKPGSKNGERNQRSSAKIVVEKRQLHADYRRDTSIVRNYKEQKQKWIGSCLQLFLSRCDAQ